MRFDVIEEAAKPGGAPLRVGPRFDVFRYPFERRAAELETWINPVQSRGEL